MNTMTIAGTGIRRDAEGRYSLNDLHRAAGGEDRHRPGQFTRTEQFVGLVAQIEVDAQNRASVVAVSSVRGGSEQVTYVVEQLVVAYAAWISPKFHLEVINTFLAAKKATVRRASEYGIAGPVAREYRGLLSIAKMTGLKGNQAILAAAKGTERLTGENPLQLIDAIHLLADQQVRHYTPTELGTKFGESAQAFNKRLERAGLQIKNMHKIWQATPAGDRFAVLLDTGKRHSDGTPVQQLKWLETVLEVLNDPQAA